MGLYTQWKGMVETASAQAGGNAFWGEYLEKEKEAYRYILGNGLNKLEGRLKEIAGKLNMDPVVFAGFMDGINTSLKDEAELDSLHEETELSCEIDFEKLYWNMHEAKASWLYTLAEWDGILSKERRNEITREFRKSKKAVSTKVGRNEPCPCGSGKKYKKCCGSLKGELNR
jgi:hypothetical protein